jgi:hypothetical protein
MLNLQIGAGVLIRPEAIGSLHCDRLHDLWLAQTPVHHVLIYVNETAFAPKPRVVVVLRNAKIILENG